MELITDVEVEGESLKAGMKGTVVSVYNDGAAYAVEFIRPKQMPAVVTIYPIQIKPVRKNGR